MASYVIWLKFDEFGDFFSVRELKYIADLCAYAKFNPRSFHVLFAGALLFKISSSSLRSSKHVQSVTSACCKRIRR